MVSILQEQGLKSPLTPDFLAKNLTLAVAVGVVMLWNFFVNRYWTYNDVKTTP
jgi:putative flippase GtrA